MEKELNNDPGNNTSEEKEDNNQLSENSSENDKNVLDFLNP